MVQLVRGSLVESLVRGLTPLVILGKGWGLTCLSIVHSGLEYRVHGTVGLGISSWKAGILGQGFKPLGNSWQGFGVPHV